MEEEEEEEGLYLRIDGKGQIRQRIHVLYRMKFGPAT